MTDKPHRLTEAEFDAQYDTINTSPLHLSGETLDAIEPCYLWTQQEDDNGQDWLLNGVHGRRNRVYWIGRNPWPSDAAPGSIMASWGGDIENPDPDEGDADEGDDTE